MEDQKEKIKKAAEKGELEETLEEIVEEKVAEKIGEKDFQSKKKGNKEYKDGISRRGFLKKLGIGAAGLGAASFLPSASALEVQDSSGLQVYSGGTHFFDADGDPVEVKNADLNVSGGISSSGTWSLTGNTARLNLAGGTNRFRVNDGNDVVIEDESGNIYTQFYSSGKVEVPNGNLDMGGQNITNVSLVDGAEVSEVSRRTGVFALSLSSHKLNNGEFTAMHRLSVPSGSNLEVYSVSINDNSHNTPSGLNLVIRNASTGSNLQTYNTNWSSGDPLDSFSVGGDDVVIAADNGNYSGGTGNLKVVNAIIRLRVT